MYQVDSMASLNFWQWKDKTSLDTSITAENYSGWDDRTIFILDVDMKEVDYGSILELIKQTTVTAWFILWNHHNKGW